MVSLGQARNQVRELKTRVDTGNDPRVEMMAQARSSSENTVKVVGDMMYEQVLVEGKLRRPDKIESALRLYVYPHFAHQPISSVTRQDVKAVLNNYMKQGKHGVAREAKKYLSRLFIFALEEELIDRNPIDKLKNDSLTHSERDRTLEDDELVATWQAADRLGYPWGDAVKLLMLTGCRKREITWARWSEIKPSEQALIIPSERYKTGQTLLVPLPDTAWAILQSIPRHDDSDFIFSVNNGKSPINSDTYLKRNLMKYLPNDMPSWTLHDLRRTLRTNLPRLKVPGEIAERVLGHGPKGKIEAIYNRYEYADEKRDALQKHDDFLKGLINE